MYGAGHQQEGVSPVPVVLWVTALKRVVCVMIDLIFLSKIEHTYFMGLVIRCLHRTSCPTSSRLFRGHEKRGKQLNDWRLTYSSFRPFIIGEYLKRIDCLGTCFPHTKVLRSSIAQLVASRCGSSSSLGCEQQRPRQATAFCHQRSSTLRNWYPRTLVNPLSSIAG